ncbi:hypothetical protein INR49_025208 [Caranx melampygus]|nr:hypothetical protein INR49_025208 [Caranx melampygus]
MWEPREAQHRLGLHGPMLKTRKARRPPHADNLQRDSGGMSKEQRTVAWEKNSRVRVQAAALNMKSVQTVRLSAE